MRNPLKPNVSVLGLSLSCALGAQEPPAHVYVSDEAMINTNTTGNQRRPAVAAGTDGRFLVAWHGDAAQAGFFDIQAQLIDEVGAKVGSEFQVDQASSGRVQYTPHVASGGNGNYVVVWADFNQTVTDSEVWMRRYDADANALGPAVQVNTFTTGFQRLPRVAAAQNGKFVVVWESAGQDGDGFGVFGQRFDADGSPSGAEFAVNTATAGDQDRADVDMTDAGFTVVFNDDTNGLAAQDFGAVALTGPPGQYPVLTGATQGKVGILDGTSNTLFVGERSGSVDGIVRRNGVLGNPFPVCPANAGRAFFGPLIARTRDGRQAIVGCGTQTTAPTEYNTTFRQYGWDAGTQELSDVGRPWSHDLAEALPYIEQGAYGGYQYHGAWQRNTSGNDDVFGWRCAHPQGVNMAFADGSVKFISEGISYNVFMALANRTDRDQAFTGSLAEDFAPAPAPGTPTTIVINDGTADYGTVPAGGTTDCATTGDCYNITINGPRPALDWDEAVTETLSNGVSKTWLLHVAESFPDVTIANPFIEFVEILLHNGITAGGACGGYCPLDGVLRQQMAVFLLKSRFGASFVPPPATGTVFGDVPASNPFAPWIELLYALGVTGGCQANPLLYCPTTVVNRQQMAVFLLKMREGSTYVPPGCTGLFTDVACPSLFSDWIEELYNRQITGGCVANPLQYCPTNPTNRQQMAVFLVKTFGLLLYGP